ncbi:hypothetical protein [Streptomyces sp. H72]
MSGVPIVVHRPSLSEGRRVTVHRHGRDEILDTQRSRPGAVPRRRRITDPDAVVDDGRWVKWRGGAAHDFRAA